MNRWATMILWDGADANSDQIVKQSAVEHLTICLVPDVDAAAVLAKDLVDQGVELIELCGGLGVEAAATIARAVNGRAAVGAVAFGIESITQAAAYKAKFDALAETAGG